MNRIHSIHVDATNKTVFVDFYQLVIFHCLVSDTIVPVFYVLMSSKTRLSYDAVFLKIRPLAPQFNPETSVSEFEIALYSSIRFVFGSNLQGCLFHYRQSVYRKWQLREGILRRRYRRKMSKASHKIISDAEGRLATGRFTAQEILQIVSLVTEKSFEKMADGENNQENIEKDVRLMTSEDPLECFEIECDEDETDCTKCCAFELEKNNFCANPCGHLMCTFCIEEDKCLKCHPKIDSKFAIFFEL